MRVGDEKDPDEADTVGAITLRAEHVRIEGNQLNFHFLGKDSVEWDKTLPAPPKLFETFKITCRQAKNTSSKVLTPKKLRVFSLRKCQNSQQKYFAPGNAPPRLKPRLRSSRTEKTDKRLT